LSARSDDSAFKSGGLDKTLALEGRSVSYFAMWKFFCWGDGPSESASDNTAWSAVYGNGTDVLFRSGESTYNVYLISDTAQNVTSQMDKLLTMGCQIVFVI